MAIQNQSGDPPVIPQLPEEGETDLRSHLQLLWRRRWWVAVPAGLCLLAGLLYALLWPPTYAIEAKVIVQSATPQSQLPAALSFAVPSAMLPHGGAGNDSDLLDSWVTYCRAAELLDVRHDLLRSVSTGKRVIGSFGDLDPDLLDTKVEPAKYEALVISKSPVAEALDNVEIGAPRDSSALTITTTSTDPAIAADVVNAFTLAYLIGKWQDSQALATYNLDRLAEEVTLSEQQLREAERALTEYQRAALPREDIVSSLDEAKALYTNLTDLQKQKIALQSQLDGARARLSGLKTQLGKQQQELVTSSQIAASPVVAQLNTQLATLYGQRLTLLEQFTSRSAEVQGVERQIAKLKQQIAQEIQTVQAGQTKTINPTYQQLISAVVALEAEVLADDKQMGPLDDALAKANRKLARLPQDAITLANLQGEVDAARQRYADVRQSQEQMRITRDNLSSDVRIVTPGYVSPELEPIKPKKAMAVASSLFGGLVLGVLLALMADFLTDRYSDLWAVERDLGVPALGVLPPLNTRGVPLLVQDGVEAGLLNGIESLLSHVQLAGQERSVRSLLVTSSGPAEGKTTIAANLALAAARGGRRVVLVDGDLEHGTLGALLGVPRSPGLAEVIEERAALEEALQHPAGGGGTMPEGLEILPAGSGAGAAVALVSSPALDGVLAQLADRADWIVVDGPTVRPFNEAQAWSAKVGGVLLVVDFTKTRTRQLRTAAKLLQTARAAVLGFACNRAPDPSLGRGDGGVGGGGRGHGATS